MKKNICSCIPINLCFECQPWTKHFPKNWLFSNFNWRNRSHLIFLEVKDWKKISKNQPSVKFEQNFQKKNKSLFWNPCKILYNVFEGDNSTMVFLHILDDFKYAVTFIKVLCSHGLNSFFWKNLTTKKNLGLKMTGRKFFTR